MKIKFLPNQTIVYESKQNLSGQPEVSIIIVNWNGKHLLPQCLKSCLNQAYSEYEIIVVDNNSSDGSLKYLIANYPQVTVVRNQINAGFGGAANIGASLAKGKYLLFLNNDAWLHPLAVKHLVATLKQNKKVKVAGPLVLNSNGSPQNFNSKISWLTRLFSPAKTEVLNKQKLALVFYVSSCAFFVEREFFRHLGAFDSSYFWQYEDIDFCWRARLQGAEIAICPWAVAYHYGNASKANLFLSKIYEESDSIEGEEAYYLWRNRLRLVLKNASWQLALLGSLILICQLLIKSLTALTQRKKNLARECLRALFWNLKMSPNLVQQRRKIQAKRVLTDKTILEQPISFQLEDRKEKIS